ncbi:sigma-70 family RNA polymerase sigma factor [Vicingus serpentipes]|uniref:Sigma-70 family RNA polymerase sigma factor n=1 Tax=Vicingus serpentipes TaxID=1926625 RepID=A0A5C6RVV0_9FLAO|nr:sigma-70 family RNA polymerase sigma factor [Vicingus serpentipes]TXB66164.1 sigma-70 family RNA polymerase sigma factor [Vicingus serpentipes]
MKPQSEENLQQVISKFKPLITSILKSKGCSYELIKDLEQDIYVKIYLNFSKYNNEKGALGAWVRTITNNVFIDYCRSKSHKYELQTKGISKSEYALKTSDVSDQLINYKMNHKILKEVLANLPSRHADVISMVYFEELSYNEIADKLNIPSKQVASVKIRAISYLQKAMSSLGYSKAMFF